MEYLKIIPKLKPNETITIILDYLKNNGFSEDWYEFDPTIARSFSYATGPIWEIVIPGFNGGSVLGGERFDKLIEQVAGIDIPGTGFGLGFDRTLEAIEQFGLLPDIKTKTQALITIFDINLASKSTELAMKFRNNNINTELYANPKAKLDKQLKYADQKNIPYIIILGPDELKNNTITLKNLKTREQETSSIEDIIIKLKA